MLAMSLQSFQKALADLIARPDQCRIMRTNPTQILDRYELTPREQRRLIAIVQQPGMATSCTLYRANRITPLYIFLPSTCFLLGEDLIREAELFWEIFRETNLQFKQEIDNFAEYLKERMNEGAIQNSLLEEVLEYEWALNKLRFLSRKQHSTSWAATDSTSMNLPFRLNPLMKVITFRHDPSVLLRYLKEMCPLPYDLIEGEFFLLLDATGPELQVKQIDPAFGRALKGIEAEGISLLTLEDVKVLLEAGFIVNK